MKKIYFLVFITLLCVLNFAYYPQSLWQATNGPYASSVKSIMSDSLDNIVIQEDSVLFLSTDSGSIWKQSGITYGDVVMDPKGYIYNTGSNGGYSGEFINISSDLGTTWQKILNESYGTEIRGIGVCKNGNILAYTYDYYGSTENILVSSDRGYSWINAKLLSFSSGDKFIDFFASNNAGYVFGISRMFGTLFRSNDSGLNWSELNAIFGFDSLKCVAVDNNGNLFLGGVGGVYHSTDYGDTWLSQELKGEIINSITVSKDSSLYSASTDDGIFKSTDNGATWSSINNGIDNPEVICLDITYNDILFAGTNGNGLFRSKDNGENWQQSKGTSLTGINSIAVTPGNCILAATNFGIFRTIDKGQNWIHLINGLPRNSLVSSLTTASNGFVYAAIPSKGIYRSTDYGLDWSLLNSPPYLDYIKLIVAGLNGELFSSSWDGVFISKDEGLSWNLILNVPEIQAIGIHPNGYIFTANEMFNSNIYRSTNDGKTWDEVESYSLGSITQFAFELNNVFVSYKYYGTGTCLMQSTNLGITWDYNKKDLHGTIGTSLILPRKEHLYIGTDEGVFLTTNNGQSWKDYNDSTNNKTVLCMAVDSSGQLCAGTAKGVFLSINPVTSVKDKSNNTPSYYSLYQNYPNPFNPTTKIEYSIPQTSFVTLKVYDILGREIATLVNEEKPAGNYSIQFIAENLSSGIYFYKLQAGKYNSVKKMILIK